MDERKDTFYEDAARHKWQIYGVLSTLGLVLSQLFRNSSIAQGVIVAFFGYLMTGRRYEWVYIFWKTWYRDYLGGKGLIHLMFRIYIWEKRNYSVAKVFTDNARKYPDKIAFHIEERAVTFREGEELSNRVAWYFKSQGLKRDDAVAILMESKPEMIFIWLGLAKIGCVSALLNHNLRGDSLIHCVNVADCTALIYGDELVDVVDEIRTDSKLNLKKLYQFNMSDTKLLTGSALLSEEIKNMPTASPSEDIKLGKPRDKVLYIYTSGTTGFPKAAIITNLRYMLIPTAVHCVFNLRSTDVVYCPLPLHHTAGGVLGAGMALVGGKTVALRKKFSASNFWNDCVKYNCTVAQYIGEICRYLLATPSCDAEKKHNVRLVVGNGLRAQIWSDFVERFRVERVGEFYGATEGNSNLINITSRVGAIGFMSRALRGIYPLRLVKCDLLTGEVLRGTDGKCIACAPNEPGILFGKINAKKAILSFAGYADKTASEKKIVRNVFQDGDCYFNTGDILVMDHFGYFYFKDRTGDTFRWRGENVSTVEVEEAINKIIGLNETVVYGVQIPNTEGRAGMAAIVDTENKVNLKNLGDNLKKSLPAYARPIFIRIIQNAPITATFKLRKKELLDQGFELSENDDRVFYMDQKSGNYVLLDKEKYDHIVKGLIRF